MEIIHLILGVLIVRFLRSWNWLQTCVVHWQDLHASVNLHITKCKCRFCTQASDSYIAQFAPQLINLSFDLLVAS